MPFLKFWKNLNIDHFGRQKIGYLFFLLLISFSIDSVNLDLSLVKNTIHPHEPNVFACIGKLIPENATVLYFNQSDGTVKFDEYMEKYFYVQYYLVPRIFAVRQSPTSKPFEEEFEWYLGEAKDIHALLSSLNPDIKLENVGICENKAILRKNNSEK
jgi:hypothetical protein